MNVTSLHEEPPTIVVHDDGSTSHEPRPLRYQADPTWPLAVLSAPARYTGNVTPSVLAAVVETHPPVDFGVIRVGALWHSFSILPDPGVGRRARYDPNAGHTTRAAALAEMRDVVTEYLRIRDGGTA